MKLSVLLVTLLVLSWTTAEDVGDQEILQQQHNDDNNHESELGEPAPQRADDQKLELGQETPTIRVARSYEFSSKSNLKWVWWRGRIPRNAVKINNKYTGSVDYVCRVGCEGGFYRKGRPYCYYPYGLKERHWRYFYMLVNRDNFEVLEWKWKKWGAVTKNAVGTCRDLYVAKNKYGLGKLHRSHKAFYLPWKGREYKYRGYYVLNVNMDVVDQKITNVRYNMRGVRVHKDRPATLRRSSVSNYQCRTVTKDVSLSKSIETSQSWDVTNSITLSVSSSVTAGIPDIVEASVTVSAETSVSMSHGTSKTESTSHSLSVSATIPPNHYCTVTMEGRKFRADIPFTARMTRKYRNGKVTSSWVSGIYKKVQVGEIRAVVHRCEKIRGAKPC